MSLTALWVAFSTGKDLCIMISAHDIILASIGPEKSIALPMFHTITIPPLALLAEEYFFMTEQVLDTMLMGSWSTCSHRKSKIWLKFYWPRVLYLFTLKTKCARLVIPGLRCLIQWCFPPSQLEFAENLWDAAVPRIKYIYILKLQMHKGNTAMQALWLSLLVHVVSAIKTSKLISVNYKVV